MYYFKEYFIMVSELNKLEYLSEVFRGLSAERKERVLNTARILLRIQGEDYSFVNNKAEIYEKEQNIYFLETSLAYVNEEI